MPKFNLIVKIVTEADTVEAAEAYTRNILKMAYVHDYEVLGEQVAGPDDV